MARTDYVRNFDIETGQVNKTKQDACLPRFFIMREADQNTGEIKEHEYVEIRVIGDRLNIRRPRVTQQHKDRWPREYEAFKRGQTVPENGHALQGWRDINESMVAELQYLGFRTVEDVASAGDDKIQNIHGGFGWRKRAQVYLQEQAQAKAVDKDAIISKLQEQVAKLMEGAHGQVSVSSGEDHAAPGGATVGTGAARNQSRRARLSPRMA